MSDIDGAAWLEDFAHEHGRRLRVLHIGNIANNAYHNAKLLIAAGADCDVLCADFYHIMGCPEWEDADFAAAIADHFQPCWAQVNLGSFERPRWFAQGPLDLCVRYLLERCAGQASAATKTWRRLGLFNGTIAVTGGDYLVLATARARLFGLRTLRFFLLPQRVADKVTEVDALFRHRGGTQGRMLRLLLHVSAPFLIATARIVGAIGRVAARCSNGGSRTLHALLDSFVERFAEEFPARTDRMSANDLMPHVFQRRKLARLFAHYDIVQAYATDVTLPMLCEKPYVAFEHGTLRSIPLDATPQGRLTALGYRLAEHVFVTNIDCIGNARMLAGERYSFLNHPYDEDHADDVAGAAALRREIAQTLDAEFIIFAPTRHDWVTGAGFADKANDNLIRAFAALRSDGNKVGLVLCEWGRNVRESRQLTQQLECADAVAWVPAMGMVNFDRHCKACDIVADQFYLGAFGGVTFKSMAAGAAVCTYLDVDTVNRMFECPPPVLNCRTTEEIHRQLAGVIAQPARLQDLRRASRRWIEEYHRGRLVVDAQCAAYRRILGTRDLVSADA